MGNATSDTVVRLRAREILLESGRTLWYLRANSGWSYGALCAADDRHVLHGGSRGDGEANAFVR